MKNMPNKKSVRRIVKDAMNNRLYMLKDYEMYVYIETVASDLETKFNKYEKDENTKK